MLVKLISDANDVSEYGYNDVEMKNNKKINFTLTASGANIIETGANSSSEIEMRCGNMKFYW